MNVSEVVQYWLDSAEDDWPVVDHLIASGDYHYALFFAHLHTEKLLKALVVKATDEHAPRTHNLLILAERAGLSLSDERREQLVRITAYNLETRYPEDRASLRERYSRAYTETEINTVREVGSWLKSELDQEKPPQPPAESE
jgi:HEPN domain-containing protein